MLGQAEEWRSLLAGHDLDRKEGSLTEPALDLLDSFRQEAGLSHAKLWLRYVELGAMITAVELETYAGLLH